MICYCGKEIDSSAGFAWQQVTYEGDKITYAICMHGVVCINQNNKLSAIIDILEDLKISCENHRMSAIEETDVLRFTNRIEALEYAIEKLKGKLV